MNKICIIGAGVSGLTCGRLLSEKGYSVKIYEADRRPGGMIKCDHVNGHLFHRTGGHVFNSKRQDVLEWFWKQFSKENEFIRTDRNSVVAMDNQFFIPYPIENHISYFDDKTIEMCIKDWLQMDSSEQGNSDVDFESFLLNRFGKTLYNIYFGPYNEKIWKRSLKNVPIEWLDGKLPMPTVEEMFFNNIKQIKEKKFVHSSFYYEKEGGSQFLANRLAEGLDIVYNSEVDRIIRIGNQWEIQGQSYDKVIFCGNIKAIPLILGKQFISTSDENMIEQLEYHGTTTVLCEIDENPYSWLYLPSRQYKAHRIICTGNFSENNRTPDSMSATIEFTDDIDLSDIEENLKRIPLNPRYIAHHYEKYTYPIQNKNTRHDITSLKEKLGKSNFFLCGRFAEWEYANMDVCMGYAIDLCKNL